MSTAASGGPGAAAEREAAAFAAYLVPPGAGPVVLARYAAALAAGADALAPRDRFDELTLALGRSGGWGLRAADGYCRLARPGAALRRRLVVLLAILETDPGAAAVIDTTGGPNGLAVIPGLAMSVIAAAVHAAIGVAVLGPVHLWAGGRPPRRP